MEDNRKSKFKKPSTTLESIKSKTKDCSLALRKESRENCLSVKRFHSQQSKDANPKEGNPQEGTVDNLSFTVENIQKVSFSFQKRSKSSQGQLKYLRTAFSMTSDFINTFLEVNNSLHTLVGYLTGNDSSLQLEAAWCITNISANDHNHVKVVAKAVSSYLITYLQSGSVLLQDQSALALGNMASDSHEIRILLQNQGVISPLINLIKQGELGVVQSAYFALCNMARSRDLVLPVLKEHHITEYIVKQLSIYSTDLNVIGELAWLLTYMTCDEENIDAFITSDTLVHLSHWINKIRPHQKEYFFAVTPLLRCLGNIFGSNNKNTDINTILSHESGGLLLTLNNFLNSNKRYLIKECLWVLSNIFSTSKEFNMSINLDDVLLLLPNIKRHLNSAYEIKKEALICVYNLAGYTELLQHLKNEEILNSLINIVKLPDVEIKYLALQFLEIIFSKVGSEAVQLFLSLDGTSYLEALAYDRNDDLRTIALHILEHYYENDEVVVE